MLKNALFLEIAGEIAVTFLKLWLAVGGSDHRPPLVTPNPVTERVCSANVFTV